MEGQQGAMISPGRALRWLTVMYVLATAAAEDQCDGPVLRMLVQSGRYSTPRTLYGVLAAFGGIPSLNLTGPLQLLPAEPRDACGPLLQQQQPHAAAHSLAAAAAWPGSSRGLRQQQQQVQPGTLFLVERGNCSFTAKYQAVLAAGGSGLILYDNVPGCITMGGATNGTNGTNSSSSPQPAHRNASDPAAVSVTRDDGLALLAELAAGASLTLRWQLLEIPVLDASALLLWLMAVGTVVGGSLWCGADYALELKAWGLGLAGPEERGHSSSSGHHHHQQQHRSSSGSARAGSGLEVLEITAAGAVGFVMASSAMLLLLYFFLNQAFFYVILAGFAAAGAQALALALLPLLLAAAPGLAGRAVTLPPWLLRCCCCCGGGSADEDAEQQQQQEAEVGLPEVIVTPVAVAVAITWAVCRNAPWSWVLQDALGVAIMLLVLRTLRLPNLRVACVLLPLCFFYDIFFVFIQPALAGPGAPSVMVEVASGAGSHEFLPMLLRVPRLSGPPIIRGAYSLLGFGDVILPGLLVALTRRLDIAAAAIAAAGVAPGSSSSTAAARKPPLAGGYFVPAVFGYGAGLLLTYVALMLSLFGDQGQPALLYLVPSTLGTVLVLAACRGELSTLMSVVLEPPDGDDDGDDGEQDDGELLHADDATGEDGGAAEQRVALLPRAAGRNGNSSGRPARSSSRRGGAAGPIGEGVLRAASPWQQQPQQQQWDSGPLLVPGSSSSSRITRSSSRQAGVQGRLDAQLLA